MTTLYFTVMQPIGLLVWIYQAQFKKEQQEFVARKLDAVGWIKYLAISVLWWLTFGFIYQSVGANRPFRDSITDATNGVGQLLMTAVYREQWIFWAATNVFSIYLWWGESLQIQGKYFIYLINSLVGWYQWSKAAKRAQYLCLSINKRIQLGPFLDIICSNEYHIILQQYRLDLLLETAYLARSTYYYQLKQLDGYDKDKEIKGEIQEIYYEHKEIMAITE